MPQELFRAEVVDVEQAHTVTRTVTLLDSGAVVVKSFDQLTINGQPTTVFEALTHFSAAEWQTITNAGFTPAPTRVVSTREFIRRFTQAEKEAMEEIAEATTQNGRRMRVIFRELDGDTTVNLDNQFLIDALNLFLKPVLVNKGTWANAATADARIAAIRGL